MCNDDRSVQVVSVTVENSTDHLDAPADELVLGDTFHAGLIFFSFDLFLILLSLEFMYCLNH